MEQTDLAASTKRNKLLNYIRDLKSRQEYPPILGPSLITFMLSHYIMVTMLGNSYMHIFLPIAMVKVVFQVHALIHLNFQNGCALDLHFATLKTIRATRLYKKVKK